MMGEHPILFSQEMRQAIREGRKTQTRRVIVSQPGPDFIHWKRDSGDTAVWWEVWWDAESGRARSTYHRCRYGATGDRLWAKEGLQRVRHDEHTLYWYAAYTDDGRLVWVDGKPVDWRWQRDYLSPIHMPKEAARLWLPVKAMRVERVQDITNEDVQAEGFAPWGDKYARFADLWDSLNAKRGYSWESNPWVWVIEFDGGQTQ